MQVDLTKEEKKDRINTIDDWKEIKVGEAFEFTRKPRSLDIPEGEPIPFIPMDGISESSRKIDYAESRTLKEIKSGSFVFKDDLLIAKITPSFENGKQAILDNLPHDYGYATTEVWVLHPKEKVKILKEYLFYYLRRGEVRTDLAGKMEGSTGRQRLPKGILKNLKLYVPSVQEQGNIVSLLKTVQDAIKQTEAVIQATCELKKSMMKHLFTYGSVPVSQTGHVELKETEVGSFPIYWKYERMEKFVHLNMGQSPPGKSYNKKGKGTPFLQGNAEFGFKHPSHKKFTTDPKKISQKGDVLFSVRAPVGAVNISDRKYCVGRGLTALSSKDGENSFLYYLMNYLSKDIERIASGSTFKAVSKTNLSKFKILEPPSEDKKRIVNILNTVEDKLIEEMDKKMSLENLFNSILESLMTAEVRI